MVEGWVRTAASPFRQRLDKGWGNGWEDAVQESLLELTRALRKGAIRDLRRLRPWVFRSTTHTCLDRVRSLGRWSWAELDDFGLTSEPSALGRLLEQGAVDSLIELAARCPEDCRRLWTMILEGLSYREMSERTGLAEGTLRVRVLRCRRQARALAESAACRDSCADAVTEEPLERREQSGGHDHGL